MRAYIGLLAAAAVAFPTLAIAQSFTPADVAAIDQGVVANLSQRGGASQRLRRRRAGRPDCVCKGLWTPRGLA